MSDETTRRRWLTSLLCGLGTGLIVPHAIQRAQALDEKNPAGAFGPLTVKVMRPFDAETPVREFTSFLTPTHRFFVRSHFGPPPEEAITEPQWKLQVGGSVERPQAFSMKALQEFEPVTITSVLQCSGNGRAFHRPKVPGVQWERGAVGNAQWTGVRLRDALKAVGIRDGAKHVQFQGADRPVAATVPLFIRSIPVAKAMHPDTLLAYEMNGRPLSLLHGAPLRVITPGWMAESCIKWLTDIVVREEEAKGYYMQTAYRVPAEFDSVRQAGGPIPVEDMPVKSLITAPVEGETVRSKRVTIQGVAWSGTAPIAKVELSFDGGRGWAVARLVGEEAAYAWRQWQFVWTPRLAGPVAILVRATDANGVAQPETSPWNPGGFLWSGWDRVNVTVMVGT